MNFTEEQIAVFLKRIETLHSESKPKFGKMNVNQMVCHCTDFFRMAMGTKKAYEYGAVDPKKVVELSRSRKTIPAPKGFGQVEGDGTSPSTLENDKRLLKEHILQFSELDNNFEFAEHPYFGHISRERWIEIANYHLNHHLKQFGV
ncbi:MAG: DUF1569 domain-containing protein [Bacteroidota bacterium]